MRKTAFFSTLVALFVALSLTNSSAQSAYTYIRYDENTMDRLDHQFIDANNSALYTSYRLTKNAGERIFLDIGIESPRIHKKEPPSMVSWQKAKIDQDFIVGINTGRRRVFICKKLDSGWAVQPIGSGIYISDFNNTLTFVSSNYDFKADFNQVLGNSMNLSLNTRSLANPANVFYIGELPACSKTAKTFKVFPSETRRYETTVTILPELGLIRENAEACPTYELVGVNGKDVCSFINGGERPAPVVAEPTPERTPIAYSTVAYGSTNVHTTTDVPQSYDQQPSVTYTQQPSTAYVPVEVPVENGEVYVRSKTVVENNNITKSDNFDYSTSTYQESVPTSYETRAVKVKPAAAKVECNYSVSEGEHLIQSGENLYSIARRYGVSVASLRDWNGLADDKLQPCTALKVVAPAVAIEEKPIVTAKSVEVPKSYNNTAVKVTPIKVEKPVAKKVIECEVEYTEGEHVVSQGDNLYAIARKYNVTKDQLLTWNKLSNDIIKPCQKLIVAAPTVTVAPKSADVPKEYKVIAKPKEAPKAVAQPTKVATKTTVTAKGVATKTPIHVKQGTGLHVVLKGETIIGLAKQFSMTEAEFRKINFMEAKETISIGQVVRTKECACTITTEADNTLSLQPVPVTNDVPKGYSYVGSKSVKTTEAAKGSNRKYHVVQATETLYAIAKTYGKSVDEIRKLNSLTETEVIIPNQLIILE